MECLLEMTLCIPLKEPTVKWYGSSRWQIFIWSRTI